MLKYYDPDNVDPDEDYRYYNYYYNNVLTGKICIGHQNGIYDVVIFPEYRRSGRASQMMQEALDIIRNTNQEKTAILFVDKTNDVAIKLYKKLGFQINHQMSSNSHFWMFKEL